MNQYEVIQTLSDNQFICWKISDEVSFRKLKEEKKRKRPHYLITKQYLYSYDHEKYTSEDEKLYSKYKDIHERIDCLLFLREKDLINLLDCFYFEQIEKNSKYTDKYFCTVEQLDDIVSLRYLLYKNRSRNTKEHQPLKHSLIFSIMACCLESCRILHALGEPYFSLSPCNILINKRTRKVSMRPFIIDKLDFLRKYIDEPLGESHIDPYTVKFTESNKVIVKEFFENQIWYSPPEFVFRLCSDIDIYKITKHKKKVYKELKHSFVNSLEGDIWSLACIFSEMVLPYPLFSAKTLEDQVTNTISVLGYGSSDSRAEIPKHIWENKLYLALAKKNIKINKLAALKGFLTANPYFEISGIALQTLSCMFDYNPSKRPGALSLLKIPIFHSLDSSTMYYRKLSEEEKKADKEISNPILVAYVNKVEEEQIQASHNRSTISEQPKENHNTTIDSIYEESIMFASLLNDKTKKRASPEKVMVESREKDLQHKKGENLVNYLSDSETKNTSFVALTYAFGKLEKIYRQQLTQIGKDIREMKEAIGDLKQNNLTPLEKKQNSTPSKVSSPKDSNIKPFKFNGDVKITIERIHDIEFEGKLMFSILMGRVEKIMEQELLSKNFTTITIGKDISKFNYEITLQIHDIVNRRITLVGEACIDVSPLSYSSDICGWYNLYDSSRQEKTGQILIRITPQNNNSMSNSPTTLTEYPSEILPEKIETTTVQQPKKQKLEDIPRMEYYESPQMNYTIVPQPIIDEVSVTSPEKRREYEKLFETSFSENEFEKKISISPETFVFSHSSASGSNSLFDDEDDLDKQTTKKNSLLQKYVVEVDDLVEDKKVEERHEDPAISLDPFITTNDILSPSQITDEPIQRLSDHVNKTPESIEIESLTSQHADGRQILDEKQEEVINIEYEIDSEEKREAPVDIMRGLEYCDPIDYQLFEERKYNNSKKIMWKIDDEGFEKPLHIIKSIKFLERVLEMSDSKAFSDAYSLSCILKHVDGVMSFISDRFNEDGELCKRIIEIVALLMEKNIQIKTEIWKNCFESLLSVFNSPLFEESNKIAYEWKMSEIIFSRIMLIAVRLKAFEGVINSLLEQLFKNLNDRLTYVKELYNGKPFYILKIYDNLVTIIFERYHPQTVEILMKETENIIILMKGNRKDDLEYMFLTKVISKIAKLKNLKALNVI